MEGEVLATKETTDLTERIRLLEESSEKTVLVLEKINTINEKYLQVFENQHKKINEITALTYIIIGSLAGFVFAPVLARLIGWLISLFTSVINWLESLPQGWQIAIFSALITFIATSNWIKKIPKRLWSLMRHTKEIN